MANQSLLVIPILLVITIIMIGLPANINSLNSAKTLSGVATCQTENRKCFGCGNGICDYPAETCSTCPQDCGLCAPCDDARCGNGRCEPSANETSCSCPEDCGVCCHDNQCREDRGENFHNCASDCATSLNITVSDALTYVKLPGARVQCRTSHKSLGPLLTSTGDVTFATVEPGGFHCRASRAGYDDNSVKLTLTSSSRGVTAYIYLLPKFGSITGYLRDSLTSEGLTGAQVSCQNGSATFLTAQSDSRGGYYLTGLASGNWTCNATHDGYHFALTGGYVPPGGHLQLDFYGLPFSTAIYGHVKNAVTGQPVAGAIVTCKQSDRYTPYNNTNLEVTEATVANANGYYYLDNINVGLTTCVAHSDGYSSVKLTVLTRSNARTVLDFELYGNVASLSGIVLDSLTNEGVLTANVTCATKIGNDSYVASTIAAFLQNGTWELSNLQPGTWQCTAMTTGWTKKVFPVLIRAGGAPFLPFVLDPLPSSISGRVTTSDGRPVPRARVTCTFPENPDLATGSQQPQLGPELTDDLGIFRFGYIILRSPLLSLNYICTASQSSFGLGIQSGTLFRDEDDHLSIVISSSGLSASVVDPDGSGVIGGASLSCKSTLTGDTFLGVTDSKGVYNFAALPPARYICYVNATGYSTDVKFIDLTSGEAGAVTFFISTVRVTVNGKLSIVNDSTPVSMATLIVRESTNTIDLFKPTVNGSGNFHFEIAPGSYFLNIESGQSFSSLSLPFTVTTSTSTLPPVINLNPLFSSISGNVQKRKRSLSNLQIDLISPSGKFLTSILTSEEGEFEFPNLESKGKYTLKIKSLTRVTRSSNEEVASEFTVEVPRLGTTVDTVVELQ